MDFLDIRNDHELVTSPDNRLPVESRLVLKYLFGVVRHGLELLKISHDEHGIDAAQSRHHSGSMMLRYAGSLVLEGRQELIGVHSYYQKVTFSTAPFEIVQVVEVQQVEASARQSDAAIERQVSKVVRRDNHLESWVKSGQNKKNADNRR